MFLGYVKGTEEFVIDVVCVFLSIDRVIFVRCVVGRGDEFMFFFVCLLFRFFVTKFYV